MRVYSECNIVIGKYEDKALAKPKGTLSGTVTLKYRPFHLARNIGMH